MNLNLGNDYFERDYLSSEERNIRDAIKDLYEDLSPYEILRIAKRINNASSYLLKEKLSQMPVGTLFSILRASGEGMDSDIIKDIAQREIERRYTKQMSINRALFGGMFEKLNVRIFNNIEYLTPNYHTFARAFAYVVVNIGQEKWRTECNSAIDMIGVVPSLKEKLCREWISIEKKYELHPEKCVSSFNSMEDILIDYWMNTLCLSFKDNYTLERKIDIINDELVRYRKRESLTLESKHFCSERGGYSNSSLDSLTKDAKKFVDFVDEIKNREQPISEQLFEKENEIIKGLDKLFDTKPDLDDEEDDEEDDEDLNYDEVLHFENESFMNRIKNKFTRKEREEK